MSLRNFNFEVDYYKISSDIRNEFYIPCLESSVKYDRTTGYFSSTIYSIIWSAMKKFIANTGKIRLICSPYLSESDAIALQEGYKNKGMLELEQNLKSEIEIMFSDDLTCKPSKALSCLVALGIVEIKIAVPNKGSETEAIRLFHDKVGIFTDEEGNSVGFKGSINETYKGLFVDGNVESIDVYPSWLDVRDKQRVENSKEYFLKLWNNQSSCVSVYDFPEASKNLLTSYSNIDQLDELIDDLALLEKKKSKWYAESGESARIPKKHQVEALETWVSHGRRGILEHATGSGKTFTAICSIRNSLDLKEVVLVLVPSRELLNQWYNDLKIAFKNESVSIFRCGDGHNSWKKDNRLQHWSSQSDRTKKIILSTMDTASTDEFLDSLSKGEHIFLVADEVHRLGSPIRQKLFSINSGPRLGLSATPKRYGDKEGTDLILNYFERIIQPPFTLKDAIESGVLTRYFYYPNLIYLTNDEQNKWNEITKKIGVYLARHSNESTVKFSPLRDQYIKRMLITRSRIVKNCVNKVELANKIISNQYSEGQKWIIYCDNQKQLKLVLEILSSKGLNAIEYHSEMFGDRDETLKYFRSNGGLLVSIKCLDEGVDIPEVTHALILASSQNPREFIQRRGRILRKSRNKHFAYLYDAIVAPINEDDESSKSLSILESELARALQFGESSENPSSILELQLIAIRFGLDIEQIKERGVEDDESE
jgi:superfamily II DNA or RNA helicase